MDFFEHDLGTPDQVRFGAFVWVKDTPYTLKEEWVDCPFTCLECETGGSYSHSVPLTWIADQFICGNPECASDQVRCIWYRYDGIAMGVDNTFGEFYCDRCNKYTFVEYQRDSS